MKRVQQKVATRFSRSALVYSEAAVLQRQVAQALASRLPTGKAKSILEVGCGNGTFTEHLAKKFPLSEIEAIDPAQGMIEVARRRLPERVKLQAVALESYRSQNKFDLIVSSSALHWMLPIDQTFVRLRRLMEDDGKLVFAMMLKGTLDELKAVRREVAPEKPPLNELPSREEVVAAMTIAGFVMQGFEEACQTIRFASGWEFMRSLQRTGVTGPSFYSGPKPLMRLELVKLVERYEQRYRDAEGLLPATYVVCFAEARV